MKKHVSYFANHNSTKACVLKFLKDKLEHSKIEKILDFTISEWRKDKSDLIKKINRDFHSEKIIIRSSAKGEDSLQSSLAGNYLSVQNIDSDMNNKIEEAIEKVINSYTQKGNNDLENQILIQSQTMNIITSGVLFTKTSDIGSPYYVINFEDGPSTDGVTKGLASSTIKILRNIKNERIQEKWKNLILAVREIEKILSSTLLDIEFGVRSDSKIVIFQVRPITSIKKINMVISDNSVTNLVQKNKNKFLNLKKHENCTRSEIAFSDMTDWNPAEIIGNNPNFLDYSLYDYLIMSKAWYQGRKLLGYQKLKHVNLMTKFGNKPYVNVKVSFNSLLPDILDKKITKKLIKFYFNKLHESPHLHDKVEFEILLSCYDLTIDDRLIELKKYGFTKKETSMIKTKLLTFTNDIICNFPELVKKCNYSLDQMTKNRKKILDDLILAKHDHKRTIYSIERLLDDAKSLGTVQFSAMARIAFIGSIILKSLRNKEIVSDDFVQSFMNSIRSPLSEIQNDLELYVKKQITQDKFLKKYGHLRPGTYDITAIRYDKNTNFFEDIKYIQRSFQDTILHNDMKINEILTREGLVFEKIGFLEFVRESLVQREKLKFEFTKNLSDTLELIAELGNYVELSRNEMADLTIKDIIKSKHSSLNKLKKDWRDKINNNNKVKTLNDHLVLPPIIFSEKDFEVVTHYLAKPNYITTKIVTGDLSHLLPSETKQNLNNTIAIIENADPGYDWIFTKGLIGLVTKYGGVASHMAIRSAELGLPAAIGCGEILFEQLLHAKRIMLDCKNQQIVVLQNEKSDEYMEERKILKSLGYIK